MKALKGLLVVAATFGLVLTGCGREETAQQNPDDLSAGNGDSDWVDVLVNVDNPDEQQGLNLAAADSYAATIGGCLSGYSKNVTEADASVNVQDGDFNCTFELTSLVYNTETYTFSGDNWTEGGSFDKTGDGGTIMNFAIVSQVDSPVSGAQSVTIIFGAAEEGASQAHAADISTGISVTGADALGLSVSGFDVLVDAVNGAGEFHFDLDCSAAVTGSGATADCNGELLEDLEYAMALDTYGPQLTLDECRALASSVGTTGPHNAGIGSNGGLDIDALDGPAALFTAGNESLIMAVGGTAADSGCKYWRVSITAP